MADIIFFSILLWCMLSMLMFLEDIVWFNIDKKLRFNSKLNLFGRGLASLAILPVFVIYTVGMALIKLVTWKPLDKTGKS